MRRTSISRWLGLPFTVVLLILCSGPALIARPAFTKKQALTSLQKRFKKVKMRVSRVLKPVDANRYPVLVVVRRRICSDSTSWGSPRPSRECQNGPVPYVGVINKSGKTLLASHLCELSTSRTVWQTDDDKLVWRAAVVKDVDGDGQKELTVFVSYGSDMFSTRGPQTYTDVFWLSMSKKKPCRTQLELAVERYEPLFNATMSYQLRYPKQNGTPYRNLMLKLTKESYEDVDDDKSKTTTVTRNFYRYHPKKDSWILVKPTKKPTRKQKKKHKQKK